MNCNFFIYDKKTKMDRQCKFKIKLEKHSESITNSVASYIYCNKHKIDYRMNSRTENLMTLKAMMMPFLIHHNFINHRSRISIILLIEKLYPLYINYIDTFEKSIFIYNKYINKINNSEDININDDINNIIYYIVCICIAFKFYESEDTDYKQYRQSKFYFNTNKYLSNYCRINLQLFNKYEVDILQMIDYNVYNYKKD
jgi:hypothetical protein